MSYGNKFTVPNQTWSQPPGGRGLCAKASQKLLTPSRRTPTTAWTGALESSGAKEWTPLVVNHVSAERAQRLAAPGSHSRCRC